MVDGLTPEYLRHRARYWRERADREADPEKQTWLRATAAVLEREADRLEQLRAAEKSRPPPADPKPS